MCNICANWNHCGYANAQTVVGSTTSSTCLCGCGQRICRDCCGNLVVRATANGSGCGYCSQRCGGQYGYQTCNGVVTGNETTTCTSCNMRNAYVCFPVSQRSGCNTAAQGNAGVADEYYARQYGLYPYGQRSFCCGSGLSAN